MEQELRREDFWPAACSAATAVSAAQQARDIESVGKWLQSCAKERATFNSYRKHVQRFIFWLYLVREKPLSALLDSDLADYVKFLDAVPLDWIGNEPDFLSSSWTPFQCQPRPSSIQQATQVVGAFLRWSRKTRSLFSAISDSPGRVFTKSYLVDFAEEILVLNAKPDVGLAFDHLTQTGSTLDVWIASLFLYAAVDPKELRFARVRDVFGSPEKMQLRVFLVDRTRRDRFIDLPAPCVMAFQRHMAQIGCMPAADAHTLTPLLASVAGNGDPPSRARLHATIKRGVGSLASVADQYGLALGNEIRKLCLLWLTN